MAQIFKIAIIHLMQNTWMKPRHTLNKIILYLGLLGIGYSQAISIVPDNPIHRIADRAILYQDTLQSGLGLRPFMTHTLIEIAEDPNFFTDNNQLIIQRSLFDLVPPSHTSEDFCLFGTGQDPSDLRSLFRRDFYHEKRHLITYSDNNNILWMDWNESLMLSSDQESNVISFRDEVTLQGMLGKRWSLYSTFTMNRYYGASVSQNIPNYRNEYIATFPENNLSIWYQTFAGIHYRQSNFDIELGKRPVIWGYSPKQSAILSYTAPAFPFIALRGKLPRLKFEFIHGSLQTYDGLESHDKTTIVQKYFAGHRLEIAANPQLTVSYNEMVVYGNRAPEFSYLIPLNSFWADEHNLGDQDNVLMAVDYFWRPVPGLALYQTFLWDELNWSRLFEPWWGNKFVLQSGIHWSPSKNLHVPDFRIEHTIARPWTYTHEDTVTSYSSAELPLGLPAGPSSHSIQLNMNWWIGDYLWMELTYSYQIKGSGPGSNHLDSYLVRDVEIESNTPFIIGNPSYVSKGKISLDYKLTAFINISVRSILSNSNKILLFAEGSFLL